jgi:hypothetical protein
MKKYDPYKELPPVNLSDEVAKQLWEKYRRETRRVHIIRWTVILGVLGAAAYYWSKLH